MVRKTYSGVPPELVDHVRSLLHPTPEQRPDAHQLVKIGWFDDVGVKTLNYLDSLFQWDNLQKSQVSRLLVIYFLVSTLNPMTLFCFCFQVFQRFASNSSTAAGTCLPPQGDAMLGKRNGESIHGPFHFALRAPHHPRGQ